MPHRTGFNGAAQQNCRAQFEHSLDLRIELNVRLFLQICQCFFNAPRLTIWAVVGQGVPHIHGVAISMGSYNTIPSENLIDCRQVQFDANLRNEMTVNIVFILSKNLQLLT